MKRRFRTLPIITIVLIIVIIPLGINYLLSPMVQRTFGPPDPGLSSLQRLRYGLELVWSSDDLTLPMNNETTEVIFSIEPGEDAYDVGLHLQEANIIMNARAFTLYLAWSGKDAYLQPGLYRLSSSYSAMTIADLFQSSSATEVTLSVLPGWRIEEIASTLSTSGLEITADEFIAAATLPHGYADLVPDGYTPEGYLFPTVYLLPRKTTADQLIRTLIQEFQNQLTPEFQTAYLSRGLSLHEAVTMASIVQKEAVIESEMPVIASVFYNRLEIGMKLQADPTVQYALGFDPISNGWWKTPLLYSDLEINSPFNTYMYPGLPPSPISNPGLAALTAVAYPSDTTFYYFQAECNGSGYHKFSETLVQHLENNCP